MRSSPDTPTGRIGGLSDPHGVPSPGYHLMARGNERRSILRGLKADPPSLHAQGAELEDRHLKRQALTLPLGWSDSPSAEFSCQRAGEVGQ